MEKHFSVIDASRYDGCITTTTISHVHRKYLPPHLELYHPPVREARAETPNFDTNASAQVI